MYNLFSFYNFLKPKQGLPHVFFKHITRARAHTHAHPGQHVREGGDRHCTAGWGWVRSDSIGGGATVFRAEGMGAGNLGVA